MSIDKNRLVSFCRSLAVAFAALAWLPSPAPGQVVDAESARETIALLERFRQDVHKMRAIAATPLGPYRIGGRCTYCSKTFIFCIEHTTEDWSQQIDFTETRERLERALQDAERHAGTFPASYEPIREWMRGIPRLSASFDEASTVVGAVQSEIRRGVGPSDQQRRRVSGVLRRLNDELRSSSALLSHGTSVLTAYLQTQYSQVQAIERARREQERIGHQALQSMQQNARTQRCGSEAAVAEFHQIEARFNNSIDVIAETFRKLQASSRRVENGLGTLLGSVVSSQTDLQSVLSLVEATGKDRLGSFLEQLHLASAKALWRSLAEGLGVEVATRYFAFPATKPTGQPWCGDFENGVDWPAAGHATAQPRGYMPASYRPRDGVPGALFAGPYQWGGERCGGWCETDGARPICYLRPAS